jgi:ethanolamine ammonia-lyase small subunit
MSALVPADPWVALRRLTPARIALGRTGASLPTREVLAFAHAHAQARDAVTTPFDSARLAGDIAALGLAVLEVESAAPDRPTYLRRPDLGRRLSPESRARVEKAAKGSCDIAVVVADGLSSTAVHAHAVGVLSALKPSIETAGWRLAPVVVARQARVALGDEVGALLGAKLMILLVGERPGLSSPDSLGAYLTFRPRLERTDAERNCISNIRGEGLSYEAAAFKIAWLAREALRLGLTGVALKDESDTEALASARAADRVEISGGPPVLS